MRVRVSDNKWLSVCVCVCVCVCVFVSECGWHREIVGPFVRNYANYVYNSYCICWSIIYLWVLYVYACCFLNPLVHSRNVWNLSSSDTWAPFIFLCFLDCCTIFLLSMVLLLNLSTFSCFLILLQFKKCLSSTLSLNLYLFSHFRICTTNHFNYIKEHVKISCHWLLAREKTN